MKIETTPEYDRWIDGLRDLAGRARIQARIERLAAGNPGQMRDLDGGLSELKIDVGPGYRHPITHIFPRPSQHLAKSLISKDLFRSQATCQDSS